jgi:hypothetical protein
MPLKIFNFGTISGRPLTEAGAGAKFTAVVNS